MRVPVAAPMVRSRDDGMMPGVRRFFRNQGLTLAVFALFLVTYFCGQVGTGWRTYNADRREAGQPEVDLATYLHSAHFAEASAENWESEFLQMFIYVVLTAHLFQRGSAESRDPAAPPERRPVTAASPWPVRRGGWWRRLYNHSLSLALALLFLVSFVWHARSSFALENEERARHGLPAVGFGEHFAGAKFWFESFQNWQSEFLAIGSMVVLSIFLREKDSPESKPVEAAHHETGG